MKNFEHGLINEQDTGIDAREIKGRHAHMETLNIGRILTASAATVAGMALFVGSGFIGAPAANAAPPMLPPGCTTIFNCQDEPPVVEPTPTPCAKPICQVVGDFDDLPVFEQADPTPTPCTKPICQVVGDFDDLPVLEEVDPAPTTPPTVEPTPTTPPTVEPTPTTPPTVEPTPTAEPTNETGNGQSGNGTGNGQTTTEQPAGSQGSAPQQGGQQTQGVPEAGDEDDETAVAEDEASESEENLAAQVEDGSSDGGFSLLMVAIVAFGIAAPASTVAYLLARRQKIAS